jgi:hypothetical protein
MLIIKEILLENYCLILGGHKKVRDEKHGFGNLSEPISKEGLWFVIENIVGKSSE